MERHIMGNNSQPVKENPVVSEKPAAAPKDKANNDAYAHMFAEWDLVPPHIAIRRVHRENAIK